MLSSKFDMELIMFAADATFTLIHLMKVSCRYVPLSGDAIPHINHHLLYMQDYYSSLVEEILSRHSNDPRAHARLLEAFQQLTVPADEHESNYMHTYEKKLEQFLPFVKGFLYYK